MCEYLSSVFSNQFSFLLCVDPVEYYGCVGVLIPSLRITDSRTHSLWSRDHVLSRFTLSVSFPSFGINNARWRLCCSCFPAGFSRDATAGDSAGDIEKLTCAGPSSLSESLLALSRLGFWLLCAVFIYCIHLYICAFTVCIYWLY